MVHARPTVCIVYGFGEGPKHAARLAAELQQRGFVLTDQAATANILVAHSGGIFVLPGDLADKTVIIMNPACATTLPYIATFMHKIAAECLYSMRQRQALRWARKALYNLWYATTRVAYTMRMIANGLKQYDRLPNMHAAQVWVVTTQSDPWARRLPHDEAARLPQYTYISYRGSHDSLWLQPEACADIVQSAYEPRLLATARTR
ncbi:MAG TPA: alpha/beta hydrolase [Candidatus Saccharimonadales bacterium]|nr:alpha/beta hydrolase [Candidatus Saccharimonadales bacterium]